LSVDAIVQFRGNDFDGHNKIPLKFQWGLCIYIKSFRSFAVRRREHSLVTERKNKYLFLSYLEHVDLILVEVVFSAA
jgi:hypothetical protein